ncbi:helix-turn-helix domain-containing protein [Liquorilactobacillus satsumensis]|uniref:helix-turn-helix domain-containing protein n=1 Tax=Liquorilactobacillus satsumensis TaxID=259059 RepID=UPI0039EB4D52
MLSSRVLNMLSTFNAIEAEQQKNHKYVEEMPASAINKEASKKDKLKVLNDYFFRNKDIYISKHNRFAAYPKHTHMFLEINYMLKGNASQVVDGNKVKLVQGDLLLLDVGAEHAIAALGEDDLLINILFRNSNINIELLKDLRRSRSVLYDFLLKSSMGENSSKQDYLIFRTAHNHKIAEILDEIIEEYFRKREFSDSVIKAYLQILITNLVRDYHIADVKKNNKSQKLVIAMLAEIDKNYATISLDKVAGKYNYNKNYLSNIFKREVGKPFSKVILQKKMTQAHTLITSTTLPISRIIEAVGITNKSYFYKKYYEFYKEKPLAERQFNNNVF